MSRRQHNHTHTHAHRHSLAHRYSAFGVFVFCVLLAPFSVCISIRTSIELSVAVWFPDSCMWLGCRAVSAPNAPAHSIHIYRPDTQLQHQLQIQLQILPRRKQATAHAHTPEPLPPILTPEIRALFVSLGVCVLFVFLGFVSFFVS